MPAVRIDNIHDPRFIMLGKCLGTSTFDAIGRLLFVWSYCTETQNHVVENEMLAALTSTENFAECLVKSGLGEVVEEGIRIKGTKGRIEWLTRLRKNGRKGGRPKKTICKPEGNQVLTKTEPPSNPLTLTITNTISNNKNLHTHDSVAREKNSAGVDTKMNQVKEKDSKSTTTGVEVWNYYESELRKRKGINAARGAKENTIAKRLASEFGVEKAKRLINSYLEDTDQFVQGQAYQIGFLYSQRQKYIAKIQEPPKRKEFKFFDSTENPDHPLSTIRNAVGVSHA